MFDVFYSGTKPNLFAHEREAESIEHAQQLSRTRFFWWISYLADYSDWDWLWEPPPWQAHQRHAWPSQWQKDSGTYLVPQASYTDTNYHVAPSILRVRGEDVNWHIPSHIENFDTTWHPDLTDPPYIYQFGTQHQRTGGPQYRVPGATDLKFVDQIRVNTTRVATAIYEIDHMDGAAGAIPNTTRRVRYFDNYRDTLIRIAKSIGPEHEFVWICSSICDYSNFDFSWHPEQWQAAMLHVFASNGEKFGDTFFMHVPTFVRRAENTALLEWYDCNFVDVSVPRRPMPVIQHSYDSQAEAVQALPFNGPLALYTTTDYVSGNLATVPLWRQETKTIVPLSAGATSVIVPKAAVGAIKTQLYDYPYIDRTHRMLKEQPLDIVFISNGEPNAKSNYLQMSMYLANESRYTNRVHVVEGVNGRVAAYHAAARASTTPWFFAVFAKLEVNQRFDWTWQPDRMQQPKHYIFHAGNPVNGLVYGHQAMIAYNRQLTLENTGVGLDFTLDQAHEVVPIVSGTAMYAETPWMAWRTAFREALKLRASLPDVENEYRLKVWLKEDSGTIANGHWSHKGAQDAVEFYEEVNGDPTELKKSYEWAWLSSYAFIKRGLTTHV
jgi:hypothetical protein